MSSATRCFRRACAVYHPILQQASCKQPVGRPVIYSGKEFYSVRIFGSRYCSGLFILSHKTSVSQYHNCHGGTAAFHNKATILIHPICTFHQIDINYIHCLPVGLVFCSNNYCSSSNNLSMADNKYIVGYAKLGTSSCKKCKQKIEKGSLRIGKVTPNPFTDDGGDMKQWFHPSCIFETFVRARATTKKIEDPDDVEGFGDLKQEDKEVIKDLIDSM